jgi:demethylmenaquinone methyltransferase/2-methoxy-6-polyprenyl-1,4-benzoquinol methylase
VSAAPRAFECLWCGRLVEPRRPDDLEVFARLCSECIGRADENQFIRFRLKRGLAARAGSGGGASARAQQVAVPTARAMQLAPARDVDAEMRAYYAARAPEYDDFYLRRGRYERGPVHDTAWQAELDQVTRWLDALPIDGEILELAAGTGWWSPLLAQKGHLTITDANREPLAIAARRLEAHGLRAGVVLRDAWDPPDREVDAVVAGFWLSHVPQARLAAFLELARAWLRPGGRFAFIDSKRDPQGSAPAPERPEVAPGVQLRDVADGRRFRVVKEYYEPGHLREALTAAGFEQLDVRDTPRFFVHGVAVAGEPPLSSRP